MNPATLKIILVFPCFSFQPSSSVNKPKTDDDVAESQEPSLLERMIEALHMELLFVRHRIAVKLANLGQGTYKISHKLQCWEGAGGGS